MMVCLPGHEDIKAHTDANCAVGNIKIWPDVGTEDEFKEVNDPADPETVDHITQDTPDNQSSRKLL